MSDVSDALATYQDRLEPWDGPAAGPFALACSFQAPATPDEVAAAWGDVAPPGDARALWAVTRQARLFEDVEYGQWGLVLLSPADSVERNRFHRELRPDEFRADDLVIGEFLGDTDVLVLAPSEAGDRRVLTALPLDDRAEWPGVGDDLADFLRRYRAAEGEKFWEPTGSG